MTTPKRKGGFDPKAASATASATARPALAAPAPSSETLVWTPRTSVLFESVNTLAAPWEAPTAPGTQSAEGAPSADGGAFWATFDASPQFAATGAPQGGSGSAPGKAPAEPAQRGAAADAGTFWTDLAEVQ